KRYRYLGTLGTGLVAIGTLLMSTITPETNELEVVRDLVIVGFGVGITFPLYLNAVQSAVEPRYIGVVTSQIQFFRNVGATIGTAILGAFLSQRLPVNIQAKILELHLPPQQLQGLGSGNAQQLFDPAAQIPAPILAAIRGALAATLQDVFLAACVAAVLAMVASVFLADVPIRRHQRGGVQASEPAPAPAFGG
ncbi:MAG: hypothetical protein QOH08_132, partial [Chloroflexota bacterium]|nr:hypothetical protein [Chloroflexota bacterium]